ncbi:XRE family transcriptional regulator, partial [Mesorhizobium sp. M5C.F.Ca.IN.020.14.1.1]
MWSANAIKSRREALSLTLTDLAQRLDVTKSYLSYIESGKRAPTPEQAVLLGK